MAAATRSCQSGPTWLAESQPVMAAAASEVEDALAYASTVAPKLELAMRAPESSQAPMTSADATPPGIV